MTCGSERSGVASSFTRRSDSTATKASTAYAMTTATRYFAESSMMRPTIMALASLRRFHGGAQAAFGVDQERGARHYTNALGDAGGDDDAIADLAPERDHVRIEDAVGPDDEGVGRSAGDDDRVARQEDGARLGEVELHGAVIAGTQVGALHGETNASRARFGIGQRVDEIDLGFDRWPATRRREPATCTFGDALGVARKDVGHDVDAREILDLVEHHLRRDVRAEDDV